MLAIFRSVLIFGLVSTAFSQTISQEQVHRHISTLAADEMQGRPAGTEFARKAADYIAQAYQKAGLEPMTGLDSFKQRFDVTEVGPKSQLLELNGKAIDKGLFAIRTEMKSFSTSDPKAFTVFNIGPDDSPRAIFMRGRATKGPQLYLMHTSHEQTYHRFSDFLRRPAMTFTPDEDVLSVVVLTDENTVNSLKFNLESQYTATEMANVVGVIPGKSKPDEIIMFSAHYDHIGKLTAVDGDDIANGADDDASGTTALMMLAQYFKHKNINERTLMFVAFTAEEMGGFGSRYMATSIDADKIVAGINIEMIGTPSKFGAGQGYLTGDDKSDLGAILRRNLEGTAHNIHPDPYPHYNLFNRSDNASFAALGVPAHSISSTPIDNAPHYHTVNDEVEVLDMAHLTAMIQAIAYGVTSLVEGVDQPTRIPTGN